MKTRTPAILATLLALGAPLLAAPAKNQAKSNAAKDSIEASFARENLGKVLDAVNANWFGQAYKDVRAVDVQGSLQLAFTAAAANAKVQQLTQGAAKGNATKGGTVNLRLKGTYFANSDFRTEFSGDFGNLLYYRQGRHGFLYSKDLNAYSTKVDPPPSNPPISFLGWFSECVNDIRDAYIKGPVFRASMGKEEASGGTVLQTIVFYAPTSKYDPKKREQTMAESLGFWKRGKLEVTFDKANHMPHSLHFTNDAQGVATRMTFHYAGGRPTQVTVENQSRGMEGPASLTVSYNNNGRIDHIAGKMGFPVGNLHFDLDTSWSSDKKSGSIATIPPMGANKKGGEELETMLLVGAAGHMLDLQRSGFNLRSLALGSK